MKVRWSRNFLALGAPLLVLVSFGCQVSGNATGTPTATTTATPAALSADLPDDLRIPESADGVQHVPVVSVSPEAEFSLVAEKDGAILEPVAAYRQGFIVTSKTLQPNHPEGWATEFLYWEPGNGSMDVLWATADDCIEQVAAIFNDAVVTNCSLPGNGPAATTVYTVDPRNGQRAEIEPPQTAFALDSGFPSPPDRSGRYLAWTGRSSGFHGQVDELWVYDVETDTLRTIVTIDQSATPNREPRPIWSVSTAGDLVAWGEQRSPAAEPGVNLLNLRTGERWSTEIDYRPQLIWLAPNGNSLILSGPESGSASATAESTQARPLPKYVVDLEDGEVHLLAVDYQWSDFSTSTNRRYLAWSQPHPLQAASVFDSETLTRYDFDGVRAFAAIEVMGEWLVWREYAPRADGVEGADLTRSYAHFMRLDNLGK